MSQSSPNTEHAGQEVGRNAITDLIDFGCGFLQSYGWYIVLALVAFYCLQPSIRQLRSQLSLWQANNPTRRKILDEEKKRIRLQQQIDLLQKKIPLSNEGNEDTVVESRATVKKRTSKKSKPKPVASAS